MTASKNPETMILSWSLLLSEVADTILLQHHVNFTYLVQLLIPYTHTLILKYMNTLDSPLHIPAKNVIIVRETESYSDDSSYVIWIEKKT